MATASVAPGLAWSPEWAWDSTAALPPGTVALAAGPDLRVAIDGLSPELIADLRGWATGGAVVARSPEHRHLLDRLVELGAVVAPMGSDVVAIVGPAEVGHRLAGLLDDIGVDVVDPDPGDAALTLVLRTGSVWPDPPAGAHLGVDLSTHHTVVLGPLVIPGAASACLTCVDTRSARRWGTPVVADGPAITRHLAAVASLVAVQVRLAAVGTSPLLNATCAWDLEAGTTDRQSAFKLVGCATCDPDPTPGRVALPWVVEEVGS